MRAIDVEQALCEYSKYVTRLTKPPVKQSLYFDKAEHARRYPPKEAGGETGAADGADDGEGNGAEAGSGVEVDLAAAQQTRKRPRSGK